jgi:hypothetical protein
MKRTTEEVIDEQNRKKARTVLDEEEFTDIEIDTDFINKPLKALPDDYQIFIPGMALPIFPTVNDAANPVFMNQFLIKVKELEMMENDVTYVNNIMTPLNPKLMKVHDFAFMSGFDPSVVPPEQCVQFINTLHSLIYEASKKDEAPRFVEFKTLKFEFAFLEAHIIASVFTKFLGPNNIFKHLPLNFTQHNVEVRFAKLFINFFKHCDASTRNILYSNTAAYFLNNFTLNDIITITQPRLAEINFPLSAAADFVEWFDKGLASKGMTKRISYSKLNPPGIIPIPFLFKKLVWVNGFQCLYTHFNTPDLN